MILLKIKGIVSEDFTNYRLPSMFIISSMCDWKCCTEQGLDIGVCQNQQLVNTKTFEAPNKALYQLFHNNDITKAVVIGGLEPFLQFNEICDLVKYFRDHGENSEFVIYSGYNAEEIKHEISILSKYNNIIVKFSRYIPNRPSRYDEVLGVTLASDNQYAQKIS